ncbi:response regulator [Legionella impletisoli]|uniref:Response regulator n=1 Tax=Legionella impletisoli TaxID=343510 RepID=A0A917JTH3_9GAMM|nr:response regulator [Legionella impletisoli]GGI83257.1 response regulator [Legionella impletisoli]
MDNHAPVDILYVEDDEVDIKSACRTFKKVNALIKVEAAKSGAEAFDKLCGRNQEESIHPKIILLDLNLPNMDGIEFLKKLRENPEFADITVFVLTGTFTTKEKLALESLNVRDHFIKPLEYSDALKIFWALEASFPG